MVELSRADRPERVAVRPASREVELREAVRRGDTDGGRLEIAVADPTADDGWAVAAGCDEVFHVGSPIPDAQAQDPDELVIPAREGTLSVVRAARDAGAGWVVLTSSFAPVGYTPKADAE